jgi:hypothetical protein
MNNTRIILMSIYANTKYAEESNLGFHFFRRPNANERKMKGISAAGAIVASRFSTTTPSILRLKPVRPVSNVTKQKTSRTRP